MTFRPENLLREARRQKGLARAEVPEICVLDPDGDLGRALRTEERARRGEGWACYHTDLHDFDHEGERFGLVANAVGAAFAVLARSSCSHPVAGFSSTTPRPGRSRRAAPPPTSS